MMDDDNDFLVENLKLDNDDDDHCIFSGAVVVQGKRPGNCVCRSKPHMPIIQRQHRHHHIILIIILSIIIILIMIKKNHLA